jgi:hypothetical protein
LSNQSGKFISLREARDLLKVSFGDVHTVLAAHNVEPVNQITTTSGRVISAYDGEMILEVACKLDVLRGGKSCLPKGTVAKMKRSLRRASSKPDAAEELRNLRKANAALAAEVKKLQEKKGFFARLFG